MHTCQNRRSLNFVSPQAILKAVAWLDKAPVKGTALDIKPPVCDIKVRFTLPRQGVSQALIHTRTAFCFCAAALTIASLGCATSNYISYETGVSPTANPLVAQYSVRHYQPGFSAWVEFGTDTTYGRQTSEVSDSASAPGGAVVNVLVAGMLPQTTYHMRAHIDTPSGSWVDTDHTFTTG